MSLVLKAKALTPQPIWGLLKWGKRACIRTLQRAFSFAGLTVARKADYYSPLPVFAELAKTRASWDKPSALAGVRYDLAAMKGRVAALFSQYAQEFAALPSYSECAAMGFGPGYPLVDALTLYTMIRELKPRRYLEVGCGLSTYYCSLAAKANGAAGYPLKIRCIEPYPFDNLHAIEGIKIMPRLVQDVDLHEFRRLEAGDVLFIDSTHALRIGGDVAFLFLEVLPVLQEGVYVHIHDVAFPYNIPYPAEHWIFNQNWPKYWTEAMLVQAFLCFNDAFEVHLSCPLGSAHG